MNLKQQEQLHEALIELKQSQEREAKLGGENKAILDAISSITLASNKQQIFAELKTVLSLYINFSDFLVLSKNNTDDSDYQTVLSTNPEFEQIRWQSQNKFYRALSGECIILYQLDKLDEFIPLRKTVGDKVQCALITGAKGVLTDSVIVMLGKREGQFSLESRDTLSRFRPILERALIDIERNEQLQELVEVRTRQLKQAQVKAEKANEAKSRFLAMMSHELRTPLSAVLGYIDVLLGDLNDESQIRLLEKMESSAELLLILIDDILELSRIESGEFNIKYQWVNLKNELEFMLEHFHTLAAAKNLQLKVDLNLQPSELIWIDSARVIQIVFNLVGNAIKFTHSGHVSLVATVRAGQLSIEVSDTGIGIERTRQEAIFAEFKQADDSITRQYGGTGLGLSISKHLVTLMNGNISVVSASGKGATFSIKLPVSIKTTEKPHGEAITNGIHCGQTLKVLVVEDTQTNQMVLKLILERLGHEVTIVNNGQESVEFVRDNISSVDIVFMDVSMPVMDGLTATKEIRKFCQHIPVIALTAHAMTQDKQACLDSGMDAFVSKPIRSKEIRAAIEAVRGSC